MNVTPLGDRVMVKAVEQDEVTASGIVLPETAKERPQRGTVLAVGRGRRGDDGERVPLGVAVGDEVIYAKYGGTELKLDGEEVLILQEHDILATVTPSEAPLAAEATAEQVAGAEPATKPRAGRATTKR
jgi:chaperonin GroES